MSDKLKFLIDNRINILYYTAIAIAGAAVILTWIILGINMFVLFS